MRCRWSAAIVAAGLIFGADAAFGANATLIPARDATLYATSDGSIANGAGSHLFIGRNSQGQTRRALLWFDIAGALPTGVVITSAALSVTVSSGDSTPLNAAIHRVTAAWGEGPSDPAGSEGQGAASQAGDATWLHTFYEGEFWATPGGDFSVVASASSLIGGAGVYTFTSDRLVGDLQSWLGGSQDNFGWIIRGDETIDGSARRIDSRQRAIGSARPTLTITYAVPAPGAGAVLLGAFVAQMRRRRVADDSLAR